MFGWKDTNAPISVRADRTGPSTDGLLITGQSGFVGGTHVASNLGWCAVETLGVGDKVLTFDHGMQTVVDIQRETRLAPEHVLSSAQCPVLVPEGALNNRKDMWLMPDQGILVESDAVMDALGDPFAIVSARALKGLRGIRSASPVDRLDVTLLAFANDEIIYVDGGMLAFCPRTRNILAETPLVDGALYDVLDMRAARALVEGLIDDDDDGAALICDPDEVAGVITQNNRPARPPRPLS